MQASEADSKSPTNPGISIMDTLTWSLLLMLKRLKLTHSFFMYRENDSGSQSLGACPKVSRQVKSESRSPDCFWEVLIVFNGL